MVKKMAAHKEKEKKGFGGLFDRAGASGFYDDKEEERKVWYKQIKERLRDTRTAYLVTRDSSRVTRHPSLVTRRIAPTVCQHQHR